MRGFELFFLLKYYTVNSNQYVRETQPNDEIIQSKCKVEINGLEITTFSKRLEISKHWTNNDYLLIPVRIPTSGYISSAIRSGREKLLSSECWFYIHLGYRYGYNKI